MEYKFKFIDLFAGIGGFRLGLENVGGQCVFSSEINLHACQMYEANFGEDPTCDITSVDVDSIPDFDVLCGGFPCQSFSICGRQKGFYDDARGTLFFDICRILSAKKPSVFFLENVAHLEKHDQGRTLTVMLNSLSQLGYAVTYKVLNARNFGVPQNRERVIIVGSKEGISFEFGKIKTNVIDSMESFLDKNNKEFEYLEPNSYTLIDNYKQQAKSGLIFRGYRNKNIRIAGVKPGTEHLSRVHKQPNRIYSSKGVHPTIASQEQSGRYWIYDNERVRKLTINECFRFMGFPDDFVKVGLNSKLYERIGNSICVKMVKEIGEEILNQLIMKKTRIEAIDPKQFLEDIYKEAIETQEVKSGLSEGQQKWLSAISKKEETFKGVYTVLFTSLTYKCLHPEQDVRMHQVELPGGYSGRTFDTKYVTPFFKIKRFHAAMKESGWLTRSLEQKNPYTLNYPGSINNKVVKNAFLNILNDIEENNADARAYLLLLIKSSLISQSTKNVVLVNPIESESKLTIDDIISKIKKHFYFKYKNRGASILPVIAFYSIYENLIHQVKRYDDKLLPALASHYSSDRSSKAAGDIVVRNADDSLYEVVEIKFDIAVDPIMIMDVYEKIAGTSMQRYYILSTKPSLPEHKQEMDEIIKKIKEEHGCQVIVNGVFETLKYYLRLLENTDDFIDSYMNNLLSHSEINYEHKIAWNKILD